jgi:hypothetical protein
MSLPTVHSAHRCIPIIRPQPAGSRREIAGTRPSQCVNKADRLAVATPTRPPSPGGDGRGKPKAASEQTGCRPPSYARNRPEAGGDSRIRKAGQRVNKAMTAVGARFPSVPPRRVGFPVTRCGRRCSVLHPTLHMAAVHFEFVSRSNPNTLGATHGTAVDLPKFQTNVDEATRRGDGLRRHRSVSQL